MSQMTQLGERLEAKDEIVVGKDILELLTGAMYVDPLSIYREYVQNAADAVEDAVEAGLFKDASQAEIHISINPQKRTVSIRDNGVGVPKRAFFRRLTAIGASDKRLRQRRGFRGVGRLSGLAYCQEMIFRSRASGKEDVCEMRWDVRNMRAALRDPKFSGSLVDAIWATVTTTTVPATDEPDHFFEVRLEGLVRVKNDVLLDEAAVRQYLAQVAPVPFPEGLSLAKQIEAHLESFQAKPRSFRVTLGSEHEQIFRPYSDRFPARTNREDAFLEFEPVTFEGRDGDAAAVGWILHHSYLGALPRSAGIGGIRLRRDNIQVGTSEIAATLFPETRFNSWVACEIHVLDRRLLPNGRRDDFEQGAHYYHLQSQLSALALKLSKHCRQVSALRVKAERVNQPVASAVSALKTVKKLELPPKLSEVALASIRSEVAKIKPAESSSHGKALARVLKAVKRQEGEASRRKKPLDRSAASRDKLLAQVLQEAIGLYGLAKGLQLIERVSITA